MSAREVLEIAKKGTIAIALGAGTAFAADKIFSLIATQLDFKTITPSVGGRLLFQAVAAGAFGCVAVYAGDQVFEMAVGDDFLSHLIFYQTSILTMGTLQSSAASVKALLSIPLQLSGPPPPQAQTRPPPIAVTAVAAEDPASFMSKPGCMSKSSCGSKGTGPYGNLNFD